MRSPTLRPPLSRRHFFGSASALGLSSLGTSARSDGTPALLGGTPARPGKRKFPSWPIFGDDDAAALVAVLRSGAWGRLDGKRVPEFEAAWGERLGADHVLATSSGTAALFTALNALGVGPGDEVIVPPYTFVATINAVLLQHALPVFVDTDPETFQIDARQIESAITGRTACILPAHIGGAAADMDTILDVSRRRSVAVVEDACQAHLAEWRGRKLGTLGDVGCFSFQASKNLTSGEGGALAARAEGTLEACRAFHNNGRSRPGNTHVRSGCNLRMTEFQAALLVRQLSRLEDQARTRERNADYLTSLLREIPGIAPARVHEGCTRSAHHLYMFRYDKEEFAGLPRAPFLRALGAEGIPASPGYSRLTQEPFLKNTLQSRAYRAIYPPERLADAVDRIRCPVNDRLCGEAVWFTQKMLLGPREDMDQIAEAVRKIRAHADRIASL
jgi:dTDP-4-amino-4,6-dideoxygalactose transaminase